MYEDDDEISGGADLDDLDDSPGYPSDDDEDLEYPESGPGPTADEYEDMEDPDAPAPIDDDDEDLELPEKTFQDGSKEVKREKTKPEDKPKKGNIHAENRVLKRENRNIDRENRELKRKLDLILEKLQEKDVSQDIEPEEEIPLEADDPIGHQAAVNRKILKKIEEREKLEQFKAQQQAFIDEIKESDRHIAEFADSSVGRDEYNKAIAYLAERDVEDIMNDDLDITEEDAVKLAAERAVERKIKWMRAGLNPGKQFYNRAVRAGYKRQSSSTPDQRRSVKQQDPKQEIKRANARDAASRTLSTATGVSARRKTTSDDISKMSDQDIEAFLDSKAKEMNGRKRGNVRISDIIEPTYR